MRITGAFAALALTAGSLVLAAPAADGAPPKPTAGGCSLSVPSRVAIVSPFRSITVRLMPNCAAAGTISATWDGIHPTQGPQEFLWFDESATEYWDLYDWDALGRWTWRPSGAHDGNYDDVAQNTAYSDIKIGSWAGLTATRSGQRVTLNASVARYATSYDRYIPWAGAAGQLQYRIKGTSTWRALAGVRTNSAGKYTYSRNWGAALEYRVYFPATAYIWNVATPTVYR
jgi:hypothetical protein